MELIDLIKNSIEFGSIVKSFNNGDLCHSILVSSDDEKHSSEFIKALCEIILNNTTKVLAGVHPDVLDFPKNGNKNMVVEDVEEIIGKSVIKPSEADFKVFVIHSNDIMRLPVQNKLLKILEEPPKDLFIILETRNSNDLLPTVLSRLHKIYLENFTLKEFEKIGLNEKVYYESGKNVAQAIKLNEIGELQKLFDVCVDALCNLKTSSDILDVSRVKLDKKDLTNIIKNFGIIFADILQAKASGKESFFEDVSKNYPLMAMAEIVEDLDLAKQKMKFNAGSQSVLDCLITAIVEKRSKWIKKI